MLTDYDYLRIGDYVVLRHPKPHEGFLAADGFLGEDLFVTKGSDRFDDCLWEVHVQNQYSAINEFRDHQELNFFPPEAAVENEESVSKSSVKGSAAMEQLKRAAHNEKVINEKLQTIKNGKRVLFGDIIQLRHVKSNKFLTVSKHMLAKHERENMRILLSSEGDSLSYLSFIPRFLKDKEGQPILSSSEIFLKVQEHQGEFIHAAKKVAKSLVGEVEREVNCSLESTFWVVEIFQNTDDLRSKIILSSQLVSFQEKESSQCLTFSWNSKLGFEDTPKIIMSPPTHISHITVDSVVGSNLLWMIEKENVVNGGPIYVNDRIVLRDINSGFYLGSDEEGLIGTRDRGHAVILEIIVQLAQESYDLIPDGCSVQLMATEGYIAKMGMIGSDQMLCETNSNQALAINFVVTTGIYRLAGVDLFIGIESTARLKIFAKQLTAREFEKKDHQVLLDAAIKVFFGSLDVLDQFLDSDLLQARTDEANSHDIMSVDIDRKIKMRQTILREQGVLDILLYIAELCSCGYLNNLALSKRKSVGSNMSDSRNVRFSGSEKSIRTNAKSLDLKNGEALFEPASNISNKLISGNNDSNLQKARSNSFLQKQGSFSASFKSLQNHLSSSTMSSSQKEKDLPFSPNQQETQSSFSSPFGSMKKVLSFAGNFQVEDEEDESEMYSVPSQKLDRISSRKSLSIDFSPFEPVRKSSRKSLRTSIIPSRIQRSSGPNIEIAPRFSGVNMFDLILHKKRKNQVARNQNHSHEKPSFIYFPWFA